MARKQKPMTVNQMVKLFEAVLAGKVTADDVNGARK